MVSSILFEVKQGIDLLHKKILGILLGDMMQEKTVITKRHIRHLLVHHGSSLALYIHAVDALVEAKTSFQFDQVFDIVFLQQTLEFLNHIVRTIEVTRTPSTNLYYHCYLIYYTLSLLAFPYLIYTIKLLARSICFYRICISLQNYDIYFDFREKKAKIFKIEVLGRFYVFVLFITIYIPIY